MKYVIAAVLALAVVIVILSVRLTALKKELKSINSQLEEILKGDTNALLTVSTRNKAVKKTALALNERIKELRKKELRLKSKNDELRTAITNISHDLRTPLTAICGYLDLLKTEEKSAEVGRCLSIIENRTDALKKLTEELFEYSLVTDEEDRLKFEEVSLNGTLEESIAAFYGAFKERGIEPQISITEATLVRILDRAALMRIFTNILSNALKYSDGDLNITLADSGKITFSNSAPKLNETQVGKLFDRFYTVESAEKSTGLGLAISRSLTESMGGSISADYRGGRLEISLYFPFQAK